jgi:hypothetical protein
VTISVWFVCKLSGVRFIYLTDVLLPAFKATNTTTLSVNLPGTAAGGRSDWAEADASGAMASAVPDMSGRPLGSASSMAERCGRR